MVVFVCNFEETKDVLNALKNFKKKMFKEKNKKSKIFFLGDHSYLPNQKKKPDSPPASQENKETRKEPPKEPMDTEKIKKNQNNENKRQLDEAEDIINDFEKDKKKDEKPVENVQKTPKKK
jgi:hypothetical protein